MKNARLALVSIGLVLVVGFFLITKQSEKPTGKCGPYRQDKIVSIGSQKINTEVVNTPTDQEKGLSGRPCIEADQGMLFVFNQPGHYFFHMKDMKFPIDIIWISTDHKAVGVERNVSPSTYPSRFVNDKQHPAQYVLEMKANRSTELGITLGTPINF